MQLSDGREMFIATSYLSLTQPAANNSGTQGTTRTTKPSTGTQGSTQTTKPSTGTQGGTQTQTPSSTGDTGRTDAQTRAEDWLRQQATGGSSDYTGRRDFTDEEIADIGSKLNPTN